MYQHENAEEPDIMSWFPRREDYEDKPAFVPDESYEEKIQRLKIWMNKVLYMSSDKFLLAVESRDLSQADKSNIRVSSFPNLCDG